jgi:hypothetical protein
MFKRMKDEYLPTGLWFELPTVTNAMVRAKFGTGLVSQDLEKYSDSIQIKSDMTGVKYSMYKCYGVWRVGKVTGLGNATQEAFDRAEIHKFFGVQEVTSNSY